MPPIVLKYGGYQGSDSGENTANRDNEPTINWNIESGMDYITTFSQLKKEGFAFIEYTLTREKPDAKTEKYYKPLTFYNLWNYDCIVSWGCDDENERLAKDWFNSYLKLEQQSAH